MAHVAYVEPESAPEAVRELYDQSAQAFGALLNVFKASGHSPELLRTLLTAFGGLGQGQLNPKLRELAYITASTTNACAY